MIKAQPFGLQSSSNPALTITARDLGLASIASVVIVNSGPGAANVYSGSSMTGTPLEIVGSNQRKYIVVGGADAVTIALPAQVTAQNGFFVGTLCNGVAVVCDDYDLRASDYARGATGVADSLALQSVFIAATDFGFDRIRGIYLPTQANPPSIYATPALGTVSVAWPLVTAAGAGINISLGFVYCVFPAAGSYFILSDQSA